MNNIQYLSKILKFICRLLLMALPFFIIAQWAIPGWLPDSLFSPVASGGELIATGSAIQGWSSPAKAIGFLGDIVGQMPLLAGVWILMRLSGRYCQGDVFSLHNARSYKQLGVLLMLYALLAEPLNEALFTFAATFNNLPGHRFISFGYSNLNVTALLCGIIITLISLVMLEASELYEEQKLSI